MSSPLDFVRNLMAGQQWPPAAEPGEAEKLRRKVEELEARLAQASKPARKRRKKKSRG